MNIEEGNFTQLPIGSIYYRYWKPEVAPRAVVLLVHGAGEHCARYEHVAALLTAKGFVVAALDHPGHGRSDGTPGFIHSFNDYLATLHSFHQRVSNAFGELPVFLLGHSMGGLISANYLLEHQHEFAGCILSGPAIKADIQPGFVAMLIIRLLAIIAPKAGVLQLEASGVSRDPEVVKAYEDDPLIHHGKISARKLRELFNAMERIQSMAQNIAIPMLLMHGSSDLMASPAGSTYLHEHIQSESNTLKLYPGLYHEIFNEPEQDEVLADLLNWLEERLASN